MQHIIRHGKDKIQVINKLIRFYNNLEVLSESEGRQFRFALHCNAVAVGVVWSAVAYTPERSQQNHHQNYTLTKVLFHGYVSTRANMFFAKYDALNREVIISIRYIYSLK